MKTKENAVPYGEATTEVLNFIVEGLSSGRYLPGERLNAARLCNELSLSKAPVREALHVLAGQGVVDLVQNRGAIIKELSEMDLLRMWDAFSIVFGREIYFAARSRMPEHSSADIAIKIDHIEKAALDFQKGKVSGINFFRAIHAWHDYVALLCDNKYIVTTEHRRQSEFWLPYVMKYIPLETYIDKYVFNYKRITLAIIAGDGSSAESGFHYHAQWSSAIIRGEDVPADAPWSP